jgi:signal transduction histidine kinase
MSSLAAGVWFLTKHEDKDEQPILEDANHEKPIRFTSELFHEFTNMLTAVIGYSELALHAIEDSHPAREWLEKIRKHTRELGALLHKLIVMKPSKHGEKL